MQKHQTSLIGTIPEATPTKNNKDVPLEALRGLAALIVILWHLLYGFAPAYTGEFPDLGFKAVLKDRAWFGLLNGGAAVEFFFVLSGFVLTRRALATGDGLSLVRGMVKRWPRLAGPITITVLLSYALFVFDGYAYEQAGALTKSRWLSTFAYVEGVPPNLGLVDALKKGVFSVLFHGDIRYESSLWTMPIEFRGSFVALALALGLVQLRRSPTLASAALAGTVALYLWDANNLYLTFVAGVLIAAWAARRPIRIPFAAAVALCLLGVYLMGYVDPRGDYRWLRIIAQWKGLPRSQVHLVGAVALIVAVEGSARMRNALSGKWAVILGELSFPLYLVHVLMICSIGAATLVWLTPLLSSPWPVLGASLTSVAAAFAIAWPLALFDKWWMRQVNRIANRTIPREQT